VHLADNDVGITRARNPKKIRKNAPPPSMARRSARQQAVLRLELS